MATRQEIINAHDALTHLISYDFADAYTEADVEEIRDREQLIRKVLPPIPQPTMADIEWDDKKHYLAEAEYEPYGSVIMLGPADDEFIEFFSPRLRECRCDSAYRGTLIPTGKRYTLTEVQE